MLITFQINREASLGLAHRIVTKDMEFHAPKAFIFRVVSRLSWFLLRNPGLPLIKQHKFASH